jgi:glutaredoxin
MADDNSLFAAEVSDDTLERLRLPKSVLKVSIPVRMDPEVIKSRGLRILPDLFNRTEGRREAKRLTGSKTVPVLVTDDGEVVSDSKKIVAWAREHPAGGGPGATAR